MMFTIRSGSMTAVIDSVGAQLMSLQSVDGTQYLWQGDPKYWPDRSLTIFPYVARLTDGCYRYRGELYHMPIHGFAPTAEFSVAEQTDAAITFVLESCPAFYEQYPFLFRYSIRYRLENATLHVEITVENKDEKTMHFGLGGHPGINVPLEEGLRFEDYVIEVPPCQPRRMEFTPACFITGRELPFPMECNQLPLSHHMFDEDAIVLKGIPGEVTLKSAKGHRGVTLMAPDFPIFGFWHMPKTDAPYICLEPWSSLPSHQDVIEDLEKQADLISLPAMGVYQTAWSLQCF